MHVPLSIFSFDDEINKKFKLFGDIYELTSHADIFNTILNISTKINLKKETNSSNYLQDLLNLEKK